MYLGGQRLAMYRNAEWRVDFFHSDHLGSTRVVTKFDKTVIDSYDYKPFGEANSGGSGTRFKFTGLENDAESGLDHTWFRKYSSTQGRWLSPDPLADSVISPQSLNRYSYVSNSALSFVDPDGRLMRDFSEPVNWGAVRGWGTGSNCNIQGFAAPCSFAMGFVNMGAAVVCPQGCDVTLQDRNGNLHLGFFFATARGAGYFTYSGPGSLFYDRGAAMGAAANANRQATAGERTKNNVVREYYSYLYDIGGVFTYGLSLPGDPCIQRPGNQWECQSHKHYYTKPVP